MYSTCHSEAADSDRIMRIRVGCFFVLRSDLRVKFPENPKTTCFLQKIAVQ